MENRRRSSSPEWTECARLLGLRLKELRLRAGLTQQQVAEWMGKTGPGGKSWVCQFEKGQLRETGISDLQELLAACGARFSDVADIIDEYAALPTHAEQGADRAFSDAIAVLPALQRKRALHYDVGVRHKGKVRLGVEERVRRAVKRGRAEEWDRRLREVFNDVLNELHVGARDPQAVILRAYGRRVFGALRRTCKTRPVWRDKALAKLDAWPGQHEQSPEPFIVMKHAVLALFDKMNRAGELD